MPHLDEVASSEKKKYKSIIIDECKQELPQVIQNAYSYIIPVDVQMHDFFIESVRHLLAFKVDYKEQLYRGLFRGNTGMSTRDLLNFIRIIDEAAIRYTMFKETEVDIHHELAKIFNRSN